MALDKLDICSSMSLIHDNFCFRGMDPMIFCGLCGVASAGVGFVAGTAVFKSVWRIWNKTVAQNLQEV